MSDRRRPLAKRTAMRVAGAAVLLSLAACVASTERSNDTASELGAAPSCGGFVHGTSPRQLAFLAPSRCADVNGAGGRWTARPLFPDAPVSSRRVACGFEWRSAGPGAASPPDVAVLRALGPSLLTDECGGPAPDGGPPVIPDGGPMLPNPVSGCDVCVEVEGMQAFVILEASLARAPGGYARTLVLTTSDGSTVDVPAPRPADDAQFYAIDLPPLVDGVHYVSGSLLAYGR